MTELEYYKDKLDLYQCLAKALEEMNMYTEGTTIWIDAKDSVNAFKGYIKELEDKKSGRTKMSTNLTTIKNTGSRNVDMDLTRYSGGEKNGVCLQLTAMQEDGKYGYVQINAKDLAKINKLWQKHCRVEEN